MAQSVDGAMIWGGKEAVLSVRALPFPHWARMAVFGPRISVAAMDAGGLGQPCAQEAWCLRIARDVWQFDQQACSSPQVLFLEKKAGPVHRRISCPFFSAPLKPKTGRTRGKPLPPALTSAICQARASWLLEDTAHQAVFPQESGLDAAVRIWIGHSPTRRKGER